MSDWVKTTWGEVSDLKYGKALRDHGHAVGPTRVFGTNGPIGYTHEAPLNLGPRPIIGRKGAYRGVHLALGPFWVIDTAYWLEPTSSLNPTWAYYALKLVDINGMDSGSAIPSLSRDHFASVPLRLPPLAEQQRIAGVLGALDDLIEVDRGLIRDLDDAFMASWELLAAECRDTEPLGAHTVVNKGLSYKGAYLVDDGLPMINMGSFGLDGSYRYSGLKKYVETEVKDKHLLNMGDLVVVNTDLTQARDILARPVLNPHKRATSTHHTFQVRVPGGEATRMWIYGALRQESTRQRLISHATGTTVAALPLDSLTQQHIPWIDESSMSRWWAAAAPLVQAHLDLIDEISQLESARDELLPLLMSGRVRVKDVAA